MDNRAPDAQPRAALRLRERVHPPQHRPAGRFTPALDFERVNNVPNFNDINPRVGAAYDLFGTGKSALKFSLGRYVDVVAGNYPEQVNPATAIVQSTNRTWNDSFFGSGDPRTGNYQPDCDLTNFGENDECGAIDNQAFGTVRVGTRFADDVLTGFGNRGYSWLGTVSFQQELRAATAVSVAYIRRWRGNFQVTDNLAVTPADYDPYCVVAPVDPRIPGGGGNQVCDLADITPGKFGQVDNLRTLASHYGDQKEVYDGIDVTLTGRFGAGGTVSGGVNVGRVATQCVQVDGPIQFCENAAPFFNPQYKVAVSYPLPWWDLQVSGIYQGLPGIPIGSAFYSTTGGQLPLDAVFTNAQIAPSLGRDLAACGTRVPCTATATAQIVEPNRNFEERLNQFDFRVGKGVRWGRSRLLGTLDLYNAFNASTPTAIVTRYGPNFLRPVSVMGGRVLKFGGQFDY